MAAGYGVIVGGADSEVADPPAEALRRKIADLMRLIRLVTDERVRIEIGKMIEELELRIREIEEGQAPDRTP